MPRFSLTRGFGNALSFDGSNDYASSTSTIDLTGTNKVTVVFWMKQGAINASSSAQVICEFSSNFNNVATGFGIFSPGQTGSGKVNMGGSLKGNVGYSGVMTTNFTDGDIPRPAPAPNVWHQYAYVFDKSLGSGAETTPYIDGVAVPYLSDITSNNTNSFGNLTLYLGSRAGGSIFLNASIDDFRVYNTALTASQIQQLYNQADSSNSVISSGLVAWWKMDEGSGSTVADSSGNGNTLTLASGSAAPSWVAGVTFTQRTLASTRPLISQSVNNYAANFVAGSSQFLNISDNTTLSMGSGVRMAFWGWFIMTNLPSKSGATMNLLAKWNTSGNQREYRLIVTTADQLRFDVSADGIASTTVTRTGALTLNTPYFVVCWYDGTNINISLNNGSTTSAAFSADIFDGTAQFRLGAQQGGEFLSGRMQSWGIAKSTSITNLLSAADRTTIYNAGKTLKHADIAGRLAVAPISWWNLDETINASTRADSVGSNTLTSNANVTAAEGNVAIARQPIRDFGTCVAFPGVTSNWIRFPDASQTGLDLQATDFTILAWVNHTGLVNASNNAAAIVAKDGRNDGSRGYRFSITGAHLLTFTITETGNTANYVTVTSNVQVPSHSWHRVAIVFVQSTSINLYIDGVLVGSSTTGIPAQPFNNNRDFEIATSNTADLFQGRMDNVQVFTRAFAATEIVTDYLGLSDSTTNNILYWKFNEGSGTAITDSTGTQVNATLVGSSWSTDVFIKPRTLVV